jgi:hypothetical protein
MIETLKTTHSEPAMKSTIKRQGFCLAHTNLGDLISQIRLDCFSIFHELAQHHKAGPIRTDSQLHALYKSGHRDLWVGAYRLLRFLPSLAGLAAHPELLEIARRCGLSAPILGIRPGLRADMPNDEEWDFPVHQDYCYNQGSLNSITLWIPLQDTDKKSGVVQFIPSSHLKGALSDSEGKIPPTLYQEKDFTSTALKCGDILAFSQFLIHRSGRNSSDKTRFSVQIRYNDLKDKHFLNRQYATTTYVEEARSLAITFPTHFPK